DTETVTINGPVTGNTSIPISAPTLTHSATSTIIVADLSHNAIVRSSATTIVSAGGNSAYIKNLVSNTTSFSLNYGEFAYLGGAASPKDGINFASAKGSISSSTIRNGSIGVDLNASPNNRIASNNFYSNGIAINVSP